MGPTDGYQTISQNSPPPDNGPSPSRRPSFFNNNAINSIEHFASSYSRAQTFLAIEPPSELSRKRSFFDASGSPVISTTSPIASRFAEDAAIDDFESIAEGDYETAVSDSLYGSFKSTTSGFPQHLHAPHRRSVRRLSTYTVEPIAGEILLEESQAISTGTETNPVIIRKVEDEEGHIVTIVAGESTAHQTIFNSVNVLIGVGLLALPLGFKYAGWVIGSIIMVISAGSTFYSAKLLAKCLDTDHTIVTYADVAYAAFGSKARLLVSILFTLELLGSGVSLVVLFSDSLNALIPWISKFQFKLIAFGILTPPSLLPLRILSFSSILGIIATFGVVFIVLFDGFYKPEGPGSLLQPMTTWIWPQKWAYLPLSIGLFMSPWGGHAVFPNIYRDMRHPSKYSACLVTTYQITFLVDISMGVLGFLMFGGLIMDEVTKNILLTDGYPPSLSYLLTVLLGLVPLAKTPLNARPIVSTLDILFGLEKVSMAVKSSNSLAEKLAKFSVRVSVVLAFVVVAIIFPDFDKVIAVVGSMLCVTICMILPLAFYIKLYDGRLSKTELIVDYFLLVVFSVVAILGTVWCIIPLEIIESMI
jgi:vesicular inhibitory amino acid transporter